MPHLRCAFRRAKLRHCQPIPHLRCHRYPGLDGLRPILTRGYQHRFTNYVRRVRPYRIGYAAQLARPNRFRKYPSGNHGSFRAALRRRRLCANHFVVMRPTSQPPAEAGITPIPSVSHCIITSSRLHLPPRIGLIRLSLTGIRNPVIRISASLTLSAGRIVKEQILASRCHPLCWGRPSSVGVRATSDERNTNG